MALSKAVWEPNNPETTQPNMSGAWHLIEGSLGAEQSRNLRITEIRPYRDQSKAVWEPNNPETCKPPNFVGVDVAKIEGSLGAE